MPDDTARMVQGLPGLGRLARDLTELKRMYDQSTSDSVAERLFRRAWASLQAGADPARVCDAIVADALVGTRLAGIDAALLTSMHVPQDESRTILQRSYDDATAGLHPGVAGRLRDSVGIADRLDHATETAWFVGALIRQPRAGATAPAKPRLALLPAESHGDHCLVVAVLGALIAMQLEGDPTRVFLAGLAHHLHNASLPDTGFAGEIMLGDTLVPLMRRLVERELATVDPALRAHLRDALLPIADADTAEGRAFNAADVIDRVLQAHHHARASAFTVDQALGDLELVHAGPLQRFHVDVLSALGLA